MGTGTKDIDECCQCKESQSITVIIPKVPQSVISTYEIAPLHRHHHDHGVELLCKNIDRIYIISIVIHGQRIYLAPDKMPTCFNKDDFRRCTLGFRQLPRIEAIVEQQRSRRNLRPSPSAVKDTKASYPVDITCKTKSWTKRCQPMTV